MLRMLGALTVVSLALLAAGRTVPVHAAIGYPSGWNLVAGPTGSTLNGATGNIYTFQAGDSVYEVLPVNSPLQSGFGYWAYFPNGGTLQAAPGAAYYSVDLSPGDVVMIGNPSALNIATVSGADPVTTYVPGGDYQQTNRLAAGQGAWATATGTIIITASPAAPAPAPAPVPLATAAPRPAPAPAPRPAGRPRPGDPGDPALVLVGQSGGPLCSIISSSRFSVRVETAVSGIDTDNPVTSPALVAIVAVVSNNGFVTDDSYMIANLQDNRGRTYKMADSEIGFTAYRNLQNTLNVANDIDPIGPGLSRRVLWVYIVPQDSVGFRLVSAYSPCP